jgi:lipopolysaccharide export system protein LptC
VGAAVSSIQVDNYEATMEARFRAAARHSRFVRVLRVAVPAIVLLSMAAIVGVSIFNPFRILAKLPLDTGNLVVSGTKITMETPHLAGYSPDGRPYELWAKAATQDLTDPDNVELSIMRAKVVMEDRSTMSLDARSGKFNSKTQLLYLYKDIFLQTTSGYEARLTQAVIDISKGTVESDQPVDVKLLNGTLLGQKMRITDNGEVVRFDGGVSMNLTMDPPTAPAPEAAPEPQAPAPDAAKPHANHGKRANAK